MNDPRGRFQPHAGVLQALVSSGIAADPTQGAIPASTEKAQSILGTFFPLLFALPPQGDISSDKLYMAFSFTICLSGP